MEVEGRKQFMIDEFWLLILDGVVRLRKTTADKFAVQSTLRRKVDSEDRKQRAEDRIQKAEDGGQKTVVRRKEKNSLFWIVSTEYWIRKEPLRGDF